MSEFDKELSTKWGFLRPVVTEGNKRAHAYFARGSVFVRNKGDADDFNVVVLAATTDDLKRFGKFFFDALELPEGTPLIDAHIYPVALMHQSHLTLEDDEL